MSRLMASKEYLRVKWMGGSSDGREQLVEKKWCVSPPSALLEGQEIQIKLGKSPGAKVWAAVYLGPGNVTTGDAQVCSHKKL